MRVARAIDRFLGQMQLEDDWTDRTVHSYASVLGRMCDPPRRGFGPEIRLDDFDGPSGTGMLRDHIGFNWGATSAGRRANVISIHHTFWGWALDEGFVDVDPAARIKRPPRRRADVYRPPAVDVELAARATSLEERGAWVLMDELGLRNSTVITTRWRDVDLTHGRVSVRVKGGHRLKLPLSPIALDQLRDVYRRLRPDLDDHVFTVERHVFEGSRRVVKVRDPKRPASPASLRAMVKRVCVRAGVKPFGPHALRHGFATRFLRDSPRRDTHALRQLMGHASFETTQHYLDELTLEELEEALRLAAEARTSVARSGDDDMLGVQTAGAASDGPGRSRTSDSAGPADDPGGPRADQGDEPPLDGSERRHKVEGPDAV